MPTRLVVAVVLLSSVAALAQEQELKKAISECAALDETADRLECFDSLARAVAQMPMPRVPVLDPRSVESRTPDEWTVDVFTNPIDDTTTIGLSLMGLEDRAQLVLRCRQKRLDVLLSWRGRFLGAKAPVVWTRLGAAKAEKKRWSLSTDGKTAFLPGDGAKPFIRELLSADRLVVQTDHFAQGTMTDAFDVHSLKDVVAHLRTECSLE